MSPHLTNKASKIIIGNRYRSNAFDVALFCLLTLLKAIWMVKAKRTRATFNLKLKDERSKNQNIQIMQKEVNSDNYRRVITVQLHRALEKVAKKEQVI